MPEGRQAVDQARAAAEPGKDHRPTQHGAQPRAVPVVGTVQPRVSRTLAVRGRRGYGSVGDRVFIVMCERSSAGRNRPIMVFPGPGWRHTPPTWAQEADQRVQKRRRAALEAPRGTDPVSCRRAPNDFGWPNAELATCRRRAGMYRVLQGAGRMAGPHGRNEWDDGNRWRCGTSYRLLPCRRLPSVAAGPHAASLSRVVGPLPDRGDLDEC